MWWKNLGLPLQSLIFGAVVAIAAWLLSSYLAGGQTHDQQRLCSSGSERVDCTWRGLAPVHLPNQGRR